VRAAGERETLDALEAELVEARQRATELEARVRTIEERLAAAETLDAPARPPHERMVEARPAPIRSIDSWRWDEAAESAYWLRRCEGFEVTDNSGVLGIVDSIRFGRDLDRPETLMVVAGRRWRRRQFAVAVSELAEVSPEEQRVRLAVPARDWLLPPSRRGRLRAVRRHGHMPFGGRETRAL
jgi:uncharacterized coiled-coil protein SlyX